MFIPKVTQVILSARGGLTIYFNVVGVLSIVTALGNGTGVYLPWGTGHTILKSSAAIAPSWVSTETMGD